MAQMNCLPHLIVYLSVGGVLWTGSPTNLVAAKIDDTVVLRRNESGTTITRTGTIAEWRGDSLTLSNENRVRQIDNAEIIDIQTDWPDEYLTGLKALQTGNLLTAIPQLQTAVDIESRPWAERTIRADLVRATTASENYDAAIQHFLRIIVDDPQSRFFHLIPLQWTTTNRIPAEMANQLIASRDPVEQLIGASWSLAGNQRDAATQALDRLSRDIDPKIQHLAIAQLWRLRGLNLTAINARQIDVWKKQIANTPDQLESGPWFVIADAQARLKQTDEAVINWMRIPILYPDQIGLSAAALYHSAHLLHNAGRDEEAQSLRSELQLKFPQSVWTKLEN